MKEMYFKYSKIGFQGIWLEKYIYSKDWTKSWPLNTTSFFLLLFLFSQKYKQIDLMIPMSIKLFIVIRSPWLVESFNFSLLLLCFFHILSHNFFYSKTFFFVFLRFFFLLFLLLFTKIYFCVFAFMLLFYALCLYFSYDSFFTSTSSDLDTNCNGIGLSFFFFQFGGHKGTESHCIDVCCWRVREKDEKDTFTYFYDS